MAAARDRLLVDLGNSRLKCASLDLKELHSFRWRQAQQRAEFQAFLQQSGVRRIDLASSSTEGLALLREEALSGIEVHVVGVEQVPLEVTTTGTGIDRLLAAWMASTLADGPVVVADCGTAFTLDVVDEDGRFLGGAIGAGLALQRQALAEACPHLDAPRPSEVAGIPQDTAAAVHAGTSRAFVAALRGLTADFLAPDVASATCFLTGGDAAELRALLPEWRHEEELVLRALQHLISKEIS